MNINGKSFYEIMDEQLKKGYTYILKVKNYQFKQVNISYLNNQYFAEDEMGMIGESEKSLNDILKRFDIRSIEKEN